MDKEVLIRSLKKQVENIEKIEKDLDRIKNKINSLVEELEDESKIGTPTMYDFGEEEYTKITKNILKVLKGDSSIIDEISEFISSLQKYFSKQDASHMKEFEKE